MLADWEAALAKFRQIVPSIVAPAAEPAQIEVEQAPKTAT
jgi:hypothetical protein